MFPNMKLIGNQQRTVTFTTFSASGTIAAGARQVVLISSSTYAGVVLGTTYPISTQVTLTPPPNDGLQAIPFTVTAGTLSAFVIS